MLGSLKIIQGTFPLAHPSRRPTLRLSTLIILYFLPLKKYYVLIIKILSSIPLSPVPIHPQNLGLFGRAPAPAPPAAPSGTLTNTLEVERLHTIVCEKVEQQLCLREGGAGGATKTSSTSSSSGSTLFVRSRSPPKQGHTFLQNFCL